MVRAAVSFRQGGSELASVGFAIDVVASPAAERKLTAEAAIATPDAADDELLTLLIEQKVIDGATRYEYRLHSEALGFNYLTLQSAPPARSRRRPRQDAAGLRVAHLRANHP
jgi:hypothetical protein